MARDHFKGFMKQHGPIPGLPFSLSGCHSGSLLKVSRIAALILVLVLFTIPVHADTSTDLVNQGNILINQSRFSQAISTFDAALAANPQNIQARVGKGTALAASGRLSESLLQFEIALSQNPTYLPALLEKGRVELATGNANGAVDSYAQALARDPANRNALEGKGDALITLGMGGEAIDSWNAALRYDPSNSRLQEKIAAARAASETEMYLWIGVIAVLLVAIAVSIWYLVVFRKRGSAGKRNTNTPPKPKKGTVSPPRASRKPSPPARVSSPEKGKNPGPAGIWHFARIQRMLKRKLGNPRAIFVRGHVVPGVSETPHSGAAAGPGPEFIPSGIALPGLGIGDPVSASTSGSVGDITHSLQVLLNTSDCKYSGDGLKGILLYSNREYEAAIREFDIEITNYPDVICISLLKVRALMHLNRFTEAFDLDCTVMKNAPNHFEAIALGAVLADHLGQTDFALRACNKATAIRHNSPLMWALKGALFHKTSRYPEGLAALQQSLELDGDSELAWKEYGDILSRTGRYPEAIQAFEKVLSLAGDDPKIRARIETCREKTQSTR